MGQGAGRNEEFLPARRLKILAAFHVRAVCVHGGEVGELWTR